MTTDYRGPMKVGQWWQPELSWDIRYENHIKRLSSYNSAVERIERLMSDTAIQGQAAIEGSKKLAKLRSKYRALKYSRDEYLELATHERRTIKAIDDGYEEP